MTRNLLHNQFFAAAEKYREKDAVISESGIHYSYGQLQEMSCQYANFLLREKLINTNNDSNRIGILSTVHFHSISAVLGCLISGSSYVPLDEKSPVSRLKKIIESSNISIIIIDPFFKEFINDFSCLKGIKTIVSCGDGHVFGSGNDVNYVGMSAIKKESPCFNHQVKTLSDDLAYVLHTSGSTGIPKGVMISHRAALSFVDWMHKEFGVDESDVVISRAPFKFDLSVFDVFNTISTGATLVCFDWNNKRESGKRHIDYVRLIVNEKVTVMYSTPSVFISLMNAGGMKDVTEDLSLSRVMYAGEPFPVPSLFKFKSILPMNCRIANIYGPTETNIITYHWINTDFNYDRSIPLGEEVDDVEIVVVNEENDLCKSNEVGEIWCRGSCVTLGYLGKPELTSQHLVTSPFHDFPCSFWRTGDYGYRDEAGILHYRGRMDQMVKVKGYRIEIGEVESAVSSLDGLDQFAVIYKKQNEDQGELYCYYTLLKDCHFNYESRIQELNALLPAYMIPHHFVFLESMPKTSSGKIDRLALQKK